jgi:hypothetical protein
MKLLTTVLNLPIIVVKLLNIVVNLPTTRDKLLTTILKLSADTMNFRIMIVKFAPAVVKLLG